MKENTNVSKELKNKVSNKKPQKQNLKQKRKRVKTEYVPRPTWRNFNLTKEIFEKYEKVAVATEKIPYDEKAVNEYIHFIRYEVPSSFLFEPEVKEVYDRMYPKTKEQKAAIQKAILEDEVKKKR